MRNPLLAARLFNTPLLVHPGKAAVVARVFLRDSAVVFVDAPATERAGISGDRMTEAFEAADYEPYPVIDGVGVIGMTGSLVNRGAYVGASSGLTSYQGLQASVRRAVSSSRIRAVAFDVDCFGGEVQGCAETATAIAELSAVKPTMAICGANCCSAAYYLAAQARKITAPEDAVVGSIGTVILHVDESRALDREGITVTFVHSGQHKVDGNSAAPLPDHVRSQMQARVDRSRQRFAEAVAAGRSGLSVADALATEAECFDGPEALRLGLIDAVAEPSAAFAAFRAAVNGAG